MRWFLIAVLLISCSREEQPQLTEWTGIRMTVPYRILVAGKADPAAIQECIDAVFQEINHTFNDWNPDSELSKLSGAESNTWIPLSPELYAHLVEVDRLVRLSQGLFDPTVGKRIRLWKDNLNHGTLPSPTEIESCPVGWNLLELADQKLLWHKPGVALDLGGVAKGLAVDRIVEDLVSIGLPNVYVDWGGEIRVAGRHPAGRPWTVAVTELSAAEPHIYQLENSAIATSGDYAQAWTIDGTTYTHILDPRTGSPLQPHSGAIASVTVIAPTTVMADALATAGMLFRTIEEAESWAATIPETRFYFQLR